MKIIDPLVFLLAFSLGLLYHHLYSPLPEIVIKYPTPFNAGKVTYRDESNVCYKYHIKEVDCPSDTSKIKKYDPIGPLSKILESS